MKAPSTKALMSFSRDNTFLSLRGGLIRGGLIRGGLIRGGLIMTKTCMYFQEQIGRLAKALKSKG